MAHLVVVNVCTETRTPCTRQTKQTVTPPQFLPDNAMQQKGKFDVAGRSFQQFGRLSSLVVNECAMKHLLISKNIIFESTYSKGMDS